MLAMCKPLFVIFRDIDLKDSAAKINARKHFAAISGTNITYDVVRTYQDLLDIVTGA